MALLKSLSISSTDNTLDGICLAGRFMEESIKPHEGLSGTVLGRHVSPIGLRMTHP
jgi:hypothetical protein